MSRFVTDVRIARRRGWVVVATVGALLGSGACGDDGEAAPSTTERSTTTTEATTTSTAPPRPTSTTTTMFDPASVEGQVEAAYLRSWEVYAAAVYDLELDEEALAEVFTGEALDLRINEVERRIREDRASLVELEHDYMIAVSGNTANVVDHFINHQVLIDPVTKKPKEPDPNERLLVNFKLDRVDGSWLVSFVQKVDQ